MDGLECCEIELSSINIDNEKYRFDSDFFQKKYITAYNKIKEISHTTIREELDVLTDFHSNGSYESIASIFKLLDTPDYAYMVRTTDLEKRDYVHNVKYVAKWTYDFLKKSKVYGGEVIINKIGNPGMTFLMPHLNRPVSLGMNQFMLRMKDNAKIDNTTLYLFLNSFIGKLLIGRKINGTVPLTIDKEAIRSIYVPCLSKNFRQLAKKIVDFSNKQLLEADELYLTSQKMLLNELNIDFSIISAKATTEKSLSKSFASTGRLDAEYYQPKYDDLFAALDRLHTKPLGQIVSITKSIEPGGLYYGSEGIPFIRVSDVSTMGINTPSIKIPKTVFPSIENLYPRKDTILFSKDGSVGIAYKMDADIEAVTSGALLHFRVKNTKEVLPDYLTLVLNSEAVQLQAERDSSGAIIQHWKPSDIEKVIIPILPINVQQKISENVQESFSLRRQAEKLIQTAVKAVEIAIETDEATALKWIENHICTDFS